MNATTEAAADGYRMFYCTEGSLTLEQINSLLRLAGHTLPIHQRTYTHYKRLLQEGHIRYITINKFDVLHGQ